jgi:hypothetical protein
MKGMIPMLMRSTIAGSVSTVADVAAAMKPDGIVCQMITRDRKREPAV